MIETVIVLIERCQIRLFVSCVCSLWPSNLAPCITIRIFRDIMFQHVASLRLVSLIHNLSNAKNRQAKLLK